MVFLKYDIQLWILTVYIGSLFYKNFYKNFLSIITHKFELFTTNNLY